MFAVCMVINGRITDVHPNPYSRYSDAVSCAQRLGYTYCGKNAGCIDFPVDGGCRIYRNDGIRTEFAVRELCDVSSD